MVLKISIRYLTVCAALMCLMVQDCPDAQGNAKIEQGRELYLSYGCAVCHGASGNGKGTVARSSNMTPTNFYDPKTYRHGTDRVSIQTIIRNGVKDETSIMPSFGHFNQQELEALSQYLVSLQNKESPNE